MYMRYSLLVDSTGKPSTYELIIHYEGGKRRCQEEEMCIRDSAYTLQEIITVKSDDVSGRVKTQEAIVKGENIPPAGTPESFKVLFKELQALGLDVQLRDKKDVYKRQS